MVRRFAQYVSAIDSRTEVPSQELLPHRYRRQPPYLYSDKEIHRLMHALRQLPAPNDLRAISNATLLGLLAVTGMRVGEAIGLDRKDVDLKRGLITVRQAKLNKSRLVPLHLTAQKKLRAYERLRDQYYPNSKSTSFFLSERGARLTDCTVRRWFIIASHQIGLRAPFIGRFLNHLEKDRGNTARSRNIRLAAIHSFFKYVALEEPSLSAVAQRVLAIPCKRHKTRPIDFLTRPEIDALLAAPDQASYLGRRDHALLLVAAQTGLRAAELIGLRCQDVFLGNGAHVRCVGKGRKARCTPLRKDAVAILRAWMRERNGQPADVLFANARGLPLSHDGLDYIVSKHVTTARDKCPSLMKKRVTPHVLRHSLAMELLQHGVDRSIIALWLGHESMETTQVYLHANLELKEQALAKTEPFNEKPTRYRPNDQLLAFLQSL